MRIQYQRTLEKMHNKTKSCKVDNVKRAAAGLPARWCPDRVVPWVSLGAGNKPSENLSHSTGYEYTLPWDYPRWYSWELGRDINNISIRTPTTTFFDYAKEVVFYPSAFDKHSPQLGRSDLTVMLLHFIAYCRGAAGIMELPTLSSTEASHNKKSVMLVPPTFAASTAAVTQQQPAMAAPTTIMAVGDSITFGCGYNAKPPDYGLECDGADSSYRSKLYGLLTAAGHPVRFVGRAKSGDVSFPAAQHAHEGYSGRRIDQLDDILFGAHPWTAAPPDVMLVMLGTNDIWHQNATVPTMRARMDSFLNHTFTRMPQTRVFLASITNMAGRVNDSKHDKIGTSNCPGHDG
eukprot:COSAG01_NODE_12861_length_1673_cov_1.749047_1_plen_346_part_01